MYCCRKITEDLTWVGGNDRRIPFFEGVYKVPHGISYNSYLLADEKTVLFDTVDQAIEEAFFENLAHALNGRKLDAIVVHHMEPDHSATLRETLRRYPEAEIICTAKTAVFLDQYFDMPEGSKITKVKEGDTFCSGKHTFTFVMAPMVHWPEVMMTYDTTSHILFSADAFGTFGSLNGAIFADEVNFEHDYLDEARRYYTNIVGKYGPQVTNVLKKASGLEISMICPLHGFVWRKDLDWYIDKYSKWASYTPEEKGVVIAYASIYGHTANAADVLACMLRERGVQTRVLDVTVTEASEVVAEVFRYSAAVFASPTYNAGVFVKMEDLLHDLAAHNIQNRTVAFVENGTWAPASAKQMKSMLENCKNMNFLEEKLTLKSSLKETQKADLETLADAIARNI